MTSTCSFAELLVVGGRRRVGRPSCSRVLAEATGSPLLREQALTSWSAEFAALEQWIGNP